VRHKEDLKKTTIPVSQHTLQSAITSYVDFSSVKLSNQYSCQINALINMLIN